MTLDTRVFLLDQIDYREVFAKCNQLIGAHEGIRWKDTGESIWNSPGQGLCALLDVTYKPVMPGEHGRYCEPDEPDESHRSCFPRFVEVSFDTAYSYRDEHGGCGELHARLVFALGQWLDEKGISWKWENEFTGEYHDRYEGLDGLTDGGNAASEWFSSTVLPAIQGLR